MNDDPDMNGVEPAFSADEALAMDVALGALERQALRAAERRMRSDHQFRTLVEDWQNRLAPLADSITPVTPPDSVWDAITAEIAPPPRVAALPARGSLWNSLALWRALAVGGAVAAAVALVPFGAQLPSATPVAATSGPVLVATLAAEDGTPLVAASYDPARGDVVLAPAGRRDDPGKSAELWVIEGKNPPRSLGVITVDHANAHLLPRERLTGLKPGSTLAISIEPLGGSPTGQPTGPVVATGRLDAV